MIESFQHKGLKRLYEDDDRSKMPPEMVERIRDILALLDVATEPADLDRPSLKLHPLKGGLRGFLGCHRPVELENDLPVRGRECLRR